MKLTNRAAAFSLAVLLLVPVSASARENGVIAGSVLTGLKVSRAPGASVAVAEHGTLVFQRGFGVKNLDSRAPVSPRTRFEVGSITKQFTATAILQLKERGRLSLTDRLGKYIPQYAAGKNVTIEQLLWQVSGIPDYTHANHFVHIAVTHRGSLSAVLALIKGKPLEFAPGTKWEYSNTNYYLLGRVVEAASGMPWDAYVRMHIFTPAKMTDSTFMKDERAVTDMATGYEQKKSAFSPSPSFTGWAGAAGSIVSTATDLLKWDRALFGGKLISDPDVRLMTQPGRLRGGKSTGYGFGWEIGTHDGTARIAHSGGTFGFTAENDVYPELGEAIVVLQNSSAASPDLVSGEVFSALNPQLAASENRPAPGEDPAITARAKEMWRQFSTAKLDRSMLTAGMNKLLSPQVLAGADEQLKPLRAPQTWLYRGKKSSAGLDAYEYLVTFGSGVKLNVTMTLDRGGKIAGYDLSPA